MVKDSKKYAASGGWGFADFTNGKPGDEALHELFREQAAAVLDDAAIGEEEKQSILAAMTCSCCGAGTMSFSVKMRPRKAQRFVAEES